MTQKNSARQSEKAKSLKDTIARATESHAFIALLIGALVLILWFHPSAFDKFWSEFQKVIKPLAALVEFLASHPLVVSALQAVQAIAFAFALLSLLLWMIYEHVRLAAPHPGAAQERAFSIADRIPLFSHRLGTVVMCLLAVFPGAPLFFTEWGYVLLPAVLVLPYIAIRVMAWVVAALFE